MMKRAGYAQLNRRPVLGEDGIPLEVLELHVYGTRLCILLGELRDALYYGSLAGVEKIQWNWLASVGNRAGTAQVSKSGKALNIELSCGERFTLALDSLQAVLCCREKFVSVAALPPRLPDLIIRNRRITDYSTFASPGRFGSSGTDDRVPA
jgi:hypothetical protein